eukprot:g49988.t1
MSVLKKEQDSAAVETKSEPHPSTQLSGLPPHLKLKIMDMMSLMGSQDKPAVQDLLTPDAKAVKPPDPIFPHLASIKENKLSQFSVEELKALNKEGFLIKDAFLGKEGLAEVTKGLEELIEGGRLRKARMNVASQKSGEVQMWASHAIRGDSICWLHRDDKDLPTGLVRVLGAIDALRVELNEALAFNSPERTQIQAACYEAGSRYTCHRDTFKGGPLRRLTVLYYANPNYQPAHQGCLRAFLPSGPRDIEPRGDRVLIFRSDWLEHEKPRDGCLAITTWFT